MSINKCIKTRYQTSYEWFVSNDRLILNLLPDQAVYLESVKVIIVNIRNSLLKDNDQLVTPLVHIERHYCFFNRALHDHVMHTDGTKSNLKSLDLLTFWNLIVGSQGFVATKRMNVAHKIERVVGQHVKVL